MTNNHRLSERRVPADLFLKVLRKIGYMPPFPNIMICDALPHLCDEQECSLYRDGKPLLIYADHLAAYGNKRLYPSFKSTVYNYEDANGAATSVER